jgi:hypothetical protein
MMLRKKLIILLLSFISFDLIAFDIYGEWKVDVDKTIKFNKIDSEEGVGECFLLNTKLYFTKIKAAHITNPNKCLVLEERINSSEFIRDFTYEVILVKNNISILEFSQGDSKDMMIQVWGGADYFSLYEVSDEILFRTFYRRK